jgi:hypothetical protein
MDACCASFNYCAFQDAAGSLASRGALYEMINILSCATDEDTYQ